MRTILTLLVLAFFSLGVSAQYGLPVDFETAMEDTAWTQFANAGDLAENMVLAENPAKDGINTSDSCLKFVVLDNADAWAGAWSESYGSFPVTSEHHVMEMMVLKDKIDRCGLKLEGDGDAIEVLLPNTVTGEWELLTFDFTAAIGKTHTRLVFFPDFPDGDRTTGGTVYIDNIQYVGGWTSIKEVYGAEINVYPNPTPDILTVKYPELQRITISNMVGQHIRSVELNNENFTRLEVSDLVPGVYFLTVDSSRGKISSKFIKE